MEQGLAIRCAPCQLTWGPPLIYPWSKQFIVVLLPERVRLVPIEVLAR